MRYSIELLEKSLRNTIDTIEHNLNVLKQEEIPKEEYRVYIENEIMDLQEKKIDYEDTIETLRKLEEDSR